jgi:hypothetical protein
MRQMIFRFELRAALPIDQPRRLGWKISLWIVQMRQPMKNGLYHVIGAEMAHRLDHAIASSPKLSG